MDGFMFLIAALLTSTIQASKLIWTIHKADYFKRYIRSKLFTLYIFSLGICFLMYALLMESSDMSSHYSEDMEGLFVFLYVFTAFIIRVSFHKEASPSRQKIYILTGTILLILTLLSWTAIILLMLFSS